ncbi:hypothetical protein M3194_13320 [Paenibacillus glycanilyticus]|uniref:nucleotidyltransferase domain-containing protein n=1 Tax=Paenibacillus glycanilyticus TaxID=126569 RepID=UPI00203B268A|nr:hypothetical protein [Paenibacillus glycanilyticus]MCM3628346.1 hypothetical protein [Paenibacillus glycanilyticus]
MRTDYNNWKPLSIMEINEIFSRIPVKWCIAGGWALDLHYGSQTREHSDIDVIITRKDQLVVFDCLSPSWILYRAENGKLSLWKGEYLDKTNDIWVSKSEESSFMYQMMIMNTEEDNWIYKRERTVQRSIHELFLTTKDGIPYLRPEVQLLHKGGSSVLREKDHNDLKTMLPVLLPHEKEWLKASLTRQFPQGHAWIKLI